MDMLSIFQLLETASLAQCRDISAHIGARLLVIERHHAGTRGANIHEAAHLMADVLLDLSRAADMQSDDE